MRLPVWPLRAAASAALLALSFASTPLAFAQGWQWARSGGSPDRDAAQGDVARGVAVDDAGNAYVVGYFEGTATFGEHTLTSAGLNDVFLVKYAPDGAVLWARRVGGVEGDVCYNVAVDAAGDAYITGRFGYPSGVSATFGDVTLTSAGIADFYIAKFSASGDVLWARGGGGPDGDRGYALAVDAAGDVYAAGYFESTAAFGDTTLTSAGGNEVFIVKYTADGTQQWARRAGGPGNDAVRELAMSPDGDVYAAGHFVATAVFGDTTLTSAGSGDGFLVRYSPDGAVRWARSAGGPQADTNFGLAVGPGGNLYVTGQFRATATFGGFLLTSAGSDDAFLAKYTPEGDVTLALSGGGPALDRGHSVAVDAHGDAYVVGYYRGTATFGAHAITSVGGNDAFVARARTEAPVKVTVTPLNPPIVLPPSGGAFRYTARVTNTTAQALTVAVRTAVTGRLTRDPLLGPVSVTLGPGASRTWTITQRVGPRAPAGLYTYHVVVDAEGVMATDRFTFEKSSGLSGAPLATGSAAAFVEAEWHASGWGNATAAAHAEAGSPDGYALSEPHPNPFATGTRLSLRLAEAQRVTAEVLDALGRRVAVLHDGPMTAEDAHPLVFDAGTLPSGHYVVRVTGERFTAARRLTLVR